MFLLLLILFYSENGSEVLMAIPSLTSCLCQTALCSLQLPPVNGIMQLNFKDANSCHIIVNIPLFVSGSIFNV